MGNFFLKIETGFEVFATTGFLFDPEDKLVTHVES